MLKAARREVRPALAQTRHADGARGCYDLRALPRRTSSRMCLLDLQPELLEAIASSLCSRDLCALASSSRAATPLHSTVISARIAALRLLTGTSHCHLHMLVAQLPSYLGLQVAAVIETSMVTFQRVCTCNEDFLRLSRAVSLRGVAAPFTSPVEAARLARMCGQTCNDVTRALLAVSIWLTDLVVCVKAASERGMLEGVTEFSDGAEEEPTADAESSHQPLSEESSEESGQAPGAALGVAPVPAGVAS